jgi:hypothetical protein
MTKQLTDSSTLEEITNNHEMTLIDISALTHLNGKKLPKIHRYSKI